MKLTAKSLPLLVCLIATQAFAADAPRKKVIDAFNTIDPKTLASTEVKLKVVQTPDAEHRKVLEMACDYAKAGAFYSVNKKIPAGMVDAAKYSGIRFWGKSDTGTKIHLSLAGEPDKDGKNFDYRVTNIVGSGTWTEFVLPFNTFKYSGYKVFKGGQQIVYPSGAPLSEADYGRISRISFVFHIEDRGAAAASTFLVDGLELIEK